MDCIFSHCQTSPHQILPLICNGQTWSSFTYVKLHPVHYFIFNYAEFQLFFLLANLSVLEDPSAIPFGQPLPLPAGIISKYHHVTVIPFLRYYYMQWTAPCPRQLTCLQCNLSFLHSISSPYQLVIIPWPPPCVVTVLLFKKYLEWDMI